MTRRSVLGSYQVVPRDLPPGVRLVAVSNGRAWIAGVERTIVNRPYIEPIHAPGPEPGNDAHPTEHIPLDRCWREGCGAQIERDDDVGLCQACVIELRDM